MPRDTKGHRRDARREATRRRLYEAALTVFRRDGVGAARIEDIVVAAGVARGSFYFHFPTKEDVLAELLAGSVERVAEAVRALPEDAPVGVILSAVATAIAAQWQDDARIFPDVATVALRFSGGMPHGSVDPLRQLVRERLAVASARGELTPLAPPEVLADLFLVTQFAVALAWSGQPQGTLSAALDGASVLFLHGAGPQKLP